uniref:hypothetical protein n=1 Tax=Singerocybe alboinfundibuliformis TaxID=1346812 RepID=UPI0030FE484B
MKTKLLNMLPITIGPTSFFSILITEYIKRVKDHKEDILQINQINNEEQMLLTQNEFLGERMPNIEFTDEVVASSSKIPNLEEVDETITNLDSKLRAINNKIGSNNLSSNETSYTENLQSGSSYLNNELLKLTENKDSFVEELQDTISKADLSTYITDLLDSFRNFVSLLSLDQLVALTNILGLFIILGTLVSISTIFFERSDLPYHNTSDINNINRKVGDTHPFSPSPLSNLKEGEVVDREGALIEKITVENKYPKIAKFITLRQTINKHYLTYNISILYLIVIVFILINIFMMVLKYFI